VRDVFVEGARRLEVGQAHQALPIALGERELPRGKGRLVIDRVVARQHAVAQEGGRARIDRELEVAVARAVPRVRLEPRNGVFGARELDAAHELAPPHQTQAQ
jgi:hypothetical protein